MNPFTPDFGTTPRLLVGRDEVLGQIGRAFGPGFDPHRTPGRLIRAGGAEVGCGVG